MSPPAPSLDLLPLLPFSLPSLLTFLSSPLATSLTHSTTNNFFRPCPQTAKIELNRGQDQDQGCWDRLPASWRQWFDSVELHQREQVLRDLADATWERPSFPPSLQSYLHSASTLTLPRTCSSTPILSYPPSPSPSLNPPPPPQPTSTNTHSKKKSNNAFRAGQSPKKAHEVQQFSALVAEILDSRSSSSSPSGSGGERPTHAIDVGSGRAHLSRALSLPPLSLHVLAVDWSSSQISGAEYLDSLKARGGGPGPTTSGKAQEGGGGSLTHLTCSLDAPSIESLLARWPPSPSEPSPSSPTSTPTAPNPSSPAPPPPPPPSLLLALHACGDLTLDAIEAFLACACSCSSSSSSGGEGEGGEREVGEGQGGEKKKEKQRAAILVGCCYNLQTPSRFPLSQTLSLALSSSPSLPPLTLTRPHLLLTAQSPPLWYDPLTPLSFPHPSPLPPGHALRRSILKLAYRARLQAELVASGLDSQQGGGEKRVGRVGECSSWAEYRGKALARFGGVEEVVELGMEVEEWEEALWKLQVFWTVRSWLGPGLESLLVLDRWCRLCEGLSATGEWEWKGEGGGGGGRKVEVRNLFEQRTGSLRNLALVVR